MDTAALRDAFLVESLFSPGYVNIVLTDMDRLILGAALPPCPELNHSFFTERREIGVINIGELGHVTVNGNPRQICSQLAKPRALEF